MTEKTDKRRKPGPPGPPCSPKTQVGRDQRDFTEKRKQSNIKAWKTRKERLK